MHFKSLRHVRDHAKVRGTAGHLLEYIALHVNYHTGTAFELTIERLAVTPQWARRLLNTLIASGEVLVERSRGRHPNRYRIPYERCHACQDTNPAVQFRVDINRDDFNPKLVSPEPATGAPPTRNSDPTNPKLDGASEARWVRIARLKEVKEIQERTNGPTRNFDEEWTDKPERQSPYWCEAHGFAHYDPVPLEHPACRLTQGDKAKSPPDAMLSPVALVGVLATSSSWCGEAI